jgi:hypothetical protein
MPDLEVVVRPFQLPSNAPPAQPYVTAQQPSGGPISLFFGRSGSGRTFTETYSLYESYYVDQEIYENPFTLGSKARRPLGMTKLF